MLLIIASLIGFFLGGLATVLLVDWLDERLRRHLQILSYEIVKGSGGIIAVAPLDPGRPSLSAVQREPGPARFESAEPENL
jgi:hypothetical protein